MKKRMILLILLCAALSLTGCGAQKEMESAPELLEPVSVRVNGLTVQRGNVSEIKVVDGEVLPYTMEVAFECDGVIREVNVYPGQEVKKGDLLATLDKTDYEEQEEELLEAIGDFKTHRDFAVKSLQITVEQKKINLRRAENSGGTREIELAKLDLEEAETALRQYMEEQALALEALEKQLEDVREKLEGDMIFAPCDGRAVFNLALRQGSSVQADKTVICVTDESRLQVRCEYVTEIHKSTSADIYCLINGGKYGIIQQEMDKEEYINAIVSGLKLYSTFLFDENEEISDVKAGMYAAICFENNVSRDTLWVPENAVYHDAEGYYVYVIEEGKREHRQVKIGIQNTRQVEIVEGLKEGEVVYVSD